MLSRLPMSESTGNYSDHIKWLRKALDTADAVVVGAGAGLSTSAGFTYTGERFERYFSDFADKYGFRDMYSGGFYPFSSKMQRKIYKICCKYRTLFLVRYVICPEFCIEFGT